MIAQIFNQNILKILTIFSISPGSRFLRKDIKDKTKLNNATLDENLNILLNTEIITKNKTMFTFNLDNKEILELVKKEHKHLNEIYSEAYFSIIELSEYLSSLKKLEVYLFGSYAKLIQHEDSDIDLAIISNNLSNKNKDKINLIISKIEKKYKKAIEIHYFSREFHKNKSDPLVKEILRNGIRII